MKFYTILLLGLCIALASGYAIYDTDELEDDKDSDAAGEDNPADSPAAPAEAAEGSAKVNADNVLSNPTPNKEKVKALEDPKKAATKDAVATKDAAATKETSKLPSKSTEKDTKASSKSDIESSKENDKEDSRDEQNEEGPEESHETATDESKGEASETSESAPASNGEPEGSGKATSAEEEVAVKASDEEAPVEGESQESPETCNLKFKKVGCYKSKKKGQGFQTFIKADPEANEFAKKGKVANSDTFNQRLPAMVCDCANEALKAGNAVFSLKNIAECWTGPDNTVYDKEGPSDKCVTFDNQKCDPTSEICSGKKHSNFVYYIDTPDHTKSQEDIAKELAKEKKEKANKHAKKVAKAHKTDSKKHKKGKKNQGKAKHTKA